MTSSGPGAFQFAILRIIYLIFVGVISVFCCLLPCISSASSWIKSALSLCFTSFHHLPGQNFLVFSLSGMIFSSWHIPSNSWELWLFRLEHFLLPILPYSVLISLKSGSYCFNSFLKFFICSFVPFPFDLIQMIQPCLLTFLFLSPIFQWD